MATWTTLTGVALSSGWPEPKSAAAPTSRSIGPVEDFTLWHPFRLGDAAKASGVSQGLRYRAQHGVHRAARRAPREAARCEQLLLSILKIFGVAEDKCEDVFEFLEHGGRRARRRPRSKRVPPSENENRAMLGRVALRFPTSPSRRLPHEPRQPARHCSIELHPRAISATVICRALGRKAGMTSSRAGAGIEFSLVTLAPVRADRCI
jgi:hypothetical protein